MPDLALVKDATDFLARRTQLERHAVARLLHVDGEALAVLGWIIEQPGCDVATAAMTFWRVRTLGVAGYVSREVDGAARRSVLEAILRNVRERRYVAHTAAWDGLEAWDRTPLVGGNVLEGLEPGDVAIPAELSGPFPGPTAAPARRVFLDSTSAAEDDIFDSLWRHGPAHVAIVDWLEGRPADVWMDAIDDLRGGHNSDIYGWMVGRPACPTSVAGQVFWILEPSYQARRLLEGSNYRGEGGDVLDIVLRRWKTGDLTPCDLDFRAYADAAAYRAMLAEFPGCPDPLEIPPDLLDPPSGRGREDSSLYEDFDYWLAIADLAGGVDRPLTAAREEWERAKRYRAEARREARERARAASRPAPLLQRVVYGGRFTGSPVQIDRAWKLFNLFSIAGGAVVVAMWRLGGPPQVTFFAFLALLLAVSGYQAFVEMGSTRRVATWWIVVAGVAIALAFLFRRIDKGVLG